MFGDGKPRCAPQPRGQEACPQDMHLTPTHLANADHLHFLDTPSTLVCCTPQALVVSLQHLERYNTLLRVAHQSPAAPYATARRQLTSPPVSPPPPAAPSTTPPNAPPSLPPPPLAPLALGPAVDVGFALVLLAAAICFASCAALARLFSRRRHRKTINDAQRVISTIQQRLTSSTTAVPQWQRGVVAVGALDDSGGAPTLVGSGIVLHLPAGGGSGGGPLFGTIISTCSHAIDDISQRAAAEIAANPAGRDSPSPSTPEMRRARPLDPFEHGVAIGYGSPVVWSCRAAVRRVSPPPAPRDPRNGLDLALLEIVDHLPGEGKVPRTYSGNGSTPIAVGRLLPEDKAGPPTPPSPILTVSAVTEPIPINNCFRGVVALPLGDDTQLRLDDDCVLLGYSRTTRGQAPTATNTRGVFAGRWDDPFTGLWLRTDALMLAGHSGGPLLNGYGEVVGWSVRSNFDRVVHGTGHYASGLNEVRPVNALRSELSALLNGSAPRGTIPPGSVVTTTAATHEAVRALECMLGVKHAKAHSGSSWRRHLRAPQWSRRPQPPRAASWVRTRRPPMAAATLVTISSDDGAPSPGGKQLAPLPLIPHPRVRLLHPGSSHSRTSSTAVPPSDKSMWAMYQV